MDNAAKALVIAGGILIGMLIISLAMYLYVSFQDAYSASMNIHDTIEVNAFNTEFTKYGFTSGDPNTRSISGADAYNILSRAYEVNNDEDALIDNITVDGEAGFSVNPQDSNFYEKRFYYSEEFSKEFKYRIWYDSDGIINRVTID